MKLGDELLDVQHDLRHILLDAGDGGELMLDAGDLDAGGRGAGQGREHDAAQRIAQGGAVAPFQGLYHIFSVGILSRGLYALDLGLLNFNHPVPSFSCGFGQGAGPR